MHSRDNNESLDLHCSGAYFGDGPGLLLQLGVRCAYLDWISGRQVWTARLCMQIVHEASSIKLIDWFDTFEEASVDVRAGATEVQSRQVPFAGVVRWDVLDQGDHPIRVEDVATPPRPRGRSA